MRGRRWMTRRSVVGGALVVLAALATSGGGTALAQEPLKIGFVYVSPVGDAGWTYQHDVARKAMEQALGGTRSSPSTSRTCPRAPTPSASSASWPSSGHKMVSHHVVRLHESHHQGRQGLPGRLLQHATGYKRDKNVGIYNARFYEGRYLTGLVAGKMTKSNIAGYVAAFPDPGGPPGHQRLHPRDARVNPKAQVKVIWVNSWYDPGKEREAAMTLISQGADVLTHHTDSTAVVQAAEEKGV